MNNKENTKIKDIVRTVSSASRFRLSSVFAGREGYRMAYAQSGYSEQTEFLSFPENEREILYPTANAIGCSFDPAVAEAVGTAVGEDLMTGGVNIAIISGFLPLRDPMSAKGAYCYSEDILHAERMCEGFARGLSGRGMGVVVDSSGVFDSAVSTKYRNNIIDRRNIKEIYTSFTKDFVRKIKPLGFIFPSGKINGINLCEDEKKVTSFRKSSSFGGIIFSPAMGGTDVVKAVNAGVLPEMTDFPQKTAEILSKAVNDGNLAAEKVEDLARKVTRASKMLRSNAKVRFMHDKEVNYTTAKNAARECFVLLENNGILPLKKGEGLNIVGKNAKEPFVQISGRYYVNVLSNPFVSVINKFAHGRYLGDFNRVDIYSQDIKESEDTFILFMGNSFDSVNEFSRIRAIPDDQKAFLMNLKDTGKRIIAVVTSPSVPAMDFTEYADAIIYDPLCGEGSAEALCEILYGYHSPSGRLNRSIPYEIEDYPSYKYSSDDENVKFAESVLGGYRYFTLGAKKAAYPFGHGLTYSEFVYSSPYCSCLKNDGTVDVSFTVKNTGSVDASEVAQVYIRDIDKRFFGPGRILKYFEKVTLSPGEEKTISFTLDKKDFAYYDIEKKTFCLASSRFAVDIASSSEDVRISIPVTVLSDEIYTGVYSKKNLPSFYPSEDKRLTVSNIDFKTMCGEIREVRGKMTVKEARAADKAFDETVNELYEKLHFIQPQKSKTEVSLDKNRKMKMLLIENMDLSAFGMYYSHLLSRPKKMSELLRKVFGE